jgi:hypothetical protein
MSHQSQLLKVKNVIVVLGLAIVASGGGCGSSRASGPDGAAGASGSGGGAGDGAGGSGGAAGTSDGSAGAGGGSDGGARDAAGGADGGIACGDLTCSTGQVCVHQHCGNVAAVCLPVPDGGQCPAGFGQVASCGPATGPGCTPPPCVEPAPRCTNVPASCGGTPTCACLPVTICNASNCFSVHDDQVNCAS